MRGASSVEAKILKEFGGGWRLGVDDATLITASESRDRDD